MNIAFANELSLVCDHLNIDVWELISLANRHPRVNILQPGPGVGGHCIAVDPWFLVSSAPEQAHLIRTAREVNDSKPGWVLDKIRSALRTHLIKNPHEDVRKVTIVIYGLAFKPDIDDLRESPALEIARAIASEHMGPLLVVEPHVDELPIELGHARLTTADKAASIGGVHVMLVDHHQFKSLSCPSGWIVDARGLWHAAPKPS